MTALSIGSPGTLYVAVGNARHRVVFRAIRRRAALAGRCPDMRPDMRFLRRYPLSRRRYPRLRHIPVRGGQGGAGRLRTGPNVRDRVYQAAPDGHASGAFARLHYLRLIMACGGGGPRFRMRNHKARAASGQGRETARRYRYLVGIAVVNFNSSIEIEELICENSRFSIIFL